MSTLGDNETVWQYVLLYGSFCMNTYMNSMVVVVFYDSNYTKLYYVLLWAMAFIQQ
jgi:hypothetical protein